MESRVGAVGGAVQPVPAVATTASGAPGMVARLQYPLLGLALLIFLLLGWRGRTPIHIGTLDENTYLSLSHSIESGSYRDMYLVGSPPHVKYPPGYPAFLTAVRLVGGDSLDLVRAINLVMLAASIVFMFLIVRRVASLGIALSVAFLLAINHVLLNSGGTVLSESLFVGLASAVIYLTVRAGPGPDRVVYLAIALALAAFLTRTAGIAVVGAVGVWLLSRRRRPELVVYVVTSIVVVGGWFTYTSLVADPASGLSYGSDVVRALRTPEKDVHPALLQIYKAGRNLAFYGVRNIPGGLALPTIAGTLVDNIAWLGVNIVLISAGTLVFWKRARAVAAYLLLYAGLLIAWPWLQSRLLVPFFPLAMAALLVGAYHLSRRLPVPARNAALAILVVLLAYGGLRETLGRDMVVRKCDLDRPYESAGCLDPETRGVARAALYIRDNTPPDAVVLALKAPGVNYLSGRLTELPTILNGIPEGQGLQRIRQLGIQYILMSRQARSIGEALLPSCAELRVIGSFGDDVALLTTEPPGTASEDACPALHALVARGPRQF